MHSTNAAPGISVSASREWSNLARRKAVSINLARLRSTPARLESKISPPASDVPGNALSMNEEPTILHCSRRTVFQDRDLENRVQERHLSHVDADET